MDKIVKAMSLLGIARRGNHLVHGETAVMEAVRRQKAHLVIVSSDASSGSKKQIEDKCRYYKIPLITGPDRETLGLAIGQSYRVLTAITDQGLSKAFLKAYGIPMEVGSFEHRTTKRQG